MKLFTLFPGIMLFLLSQAPLLAQTNYNLIVGTYTKPGKSEGIYVYGFDAKSGETKYKAKATGILNPSFLAISADNKHVYSVSEGDGQGMINAFSFDPATGKLTFMNSVSSGGDGPCYVSADNKGKYVFSGNYGGGSLAAIPVKPDGSLSDDIQAIKHTGSSIDKSRQEKPHVHAAVLSPDQKFLLTPDLGTDQVNVYTISGKNSNPLAPASPPFASVKPGSGPRHITFHPNGKFAYLIREMEGAVSVFSYNNGKLTELQSITMLADGFKGNVGAADIHVSPDGKFLYGSNRGDANELVIYAVNPKTGKLTYTGRQSTLGKAPRNFAIDPTGNFLLVGNQDSDEIIIFKRNQKNGLLTDTGKKIEVGAPVCLKFVAVSK